MRHRDTFQSQTTKEKSTTPLRRPTYDKPVLAGFDLLPPEIAASRKGDRYLRSVKHLELVRVYLNFQTGDLDFEFEPSLPLASHAMQYRVMRDIANAVMRMYGKDCLRRIRAVGMSGNRGAR